MESAIVNGVTVSLEAEGVAVGVVVARGAAVRPAPASLNDELARAIDEARARTGEEAITQPIRGLLRHGVYKPTGRGKPASEYLLKAARADNFPRINNLVDLNNLVSLESLLPISLVDIGRARTDTFRIRRGRSGEAFVFNGAGQRIELEDLLLVAKGDEDEPCANPVKDSMATKLDDQSTEVMAVLYAAPALVGDLRDASGAFAAGFRRWGGAASVDSAVLVAS